MEWFLIFFLLSLSLYFYYTYSSKYKKGKNKNQIYQLVWNCVFVKKHFLEVQMISILAGKKYMKWRKKNGKNDDDTYRTIFFITSILNYIAWQNVKSRAWSLLHLNVYLKDFLFVASLLSSYVQCKKFCNICWDLRHKVDFFILK